MTSLAATRASGLPRRGPVRVLTLGATLASLVLSLLWLEPARAGLVLDILVLLGLGAVAVRRRTGR
jgi:hypothetical protein